MSRFWNVCCSEYRTMDEVQEPSNPKYRDLNPSGQIHSFNIFGTEMWKHGQRCFLSTLSITSIWSIVF